MVLPGPADFVVSLPGSAWLHDLQKTKLNGLEKVPIEIKHWHKSVNLIAKAFGENIIISLLGYC